MRKISSQLQDATGIFTLNSNSEGRELAILDMCAAPGAFLSVASEHNPTARLRGFTLPESEGGHEVLAPDARVRDAIEHLDINFLAEDMGMRLAEIPECHPEAGRFLSARFTSRSINSKTNTSADSNTGANDNDNKDKEKQEEQQETEEGEEKEEEELYDLILLDGQVLRTHPRASYRERREAQRLAVVQMSIGLSHVRPIGGKMLVLIHKIESWKCVVLLYTLSRFADIRLFKPSVGHATRSSCYLVVENVRSAGDNKEKEKVKEVVEGWKKLWRVATFGARRGRDGDGDEVGQGRGEGEGEGEGGNEVVEDEEFVRLAQEIEPGIREILRVFGERLIELGRQVWKTQAEALARAPYCS
jgi:23S rRNA U2552 (ribose-2'-O)-methylase RlmE/FtsJ